VVQYTGIMPDKAKSVKQLFVAAEIEKLVKKNKALSEKDAKKAAAEVWAKAQADPKKTAKFKELAAAEAKRYQDQVTSIETKGYFIMSDGTKSNKKVKPSKAPAKEEVKAAEPPAKKEKFPGYNGLHPKKALTSYFIFMNEKMIEIKAGLKEDEKMGLKETAKLVGEAWGKLTEDQKKPYSVLHEEAKVIYEA
jgi:hypothetical protein